MDTPNALTFRNPSLDLRAKNPARYALEAYGTPREPTTSFGLPLLQKLFASYPELLPQAAWFSDALQREDTFLAIDSTERPFTVQIDPLSEHISIGDPSGFHQEFGYGLKNPDDEAFQLITSRYVSPSPQA